MNAVSTHTQVLENGLRELRYDMMANPLRSSTVDIETEAIILSGLRDRCSRSINHIKKLYEEARFLKAINDKVIIIIVKKVLLLLANISNTKTFGLQ